ncbi:copper resistance CopC family protein [Sinomonas albida]|uniref:copper resistance CopC family protein n=1 Tax=Sinomonas albida TaxID=369942 RepID=UPI003018068B
MTHTASKAHALLRHAAAVLALAAAVLLGAPAAQAHDVLETSSPANGATVAAVPASIVLTFDHTPIGVGTEVLVKDPTGTNQSDGPAQIVDNSVTQPLKPGAPAGAYTVIWRVVSSDSHPIEGTFTFTANRPGNGAAAASASAPETASPATAPAPAPAPAGSGGGLVLWLIIAAVVVIAFVVGASFVRRALARTPEE